MSTVSDQTPGGCRVCPYQMAFMLDNWIRRLFQNPAKLLESYIATGDTVVDMGCGPGFFSVDMARAVGRRGHVIAVDLQAGMLDRVKKKAIRHGVADCMTYHQCRSDGIGLECAADFILAFYMVHETPHPRRFFEEARSMLKTSGKLLVVEPKMHVSRASFEAMVVEAENAGLQVVDYPKGKGGRAVLLVAG